MKTVEIDHFFKTLDIRQMMQLLCKMTRQLNEEVKPHFHDNIEEYEYVHFVIIDGLKKLFVSANTLYIDCGGLDFTRSIKSMRVYESEIDMEFYMALLEYSNTLEPNHILFNGKGTYQDAFTNYIETISIATEGIKTQCLN